MGGNVFSDTVRLDRNSYLNLTQAFVDLFYPTVKPIPSYRNKESFGDLDLVVDQDSDLAIELFDKKNIAHLSSRCSENDIDIVDHSFNGPVLSLKVALDGTRFFQVDLIGTYHPDFAMNYFSYNDLGNLIGRVAHSQGLKFGHEGLKYVLRCDDSYTEELTLTENFDEAVEYLGFSSARFKKGFDSLEEIFEYVIESKNFNADFYDLEKRSHVARVRDRKRATYTKFLEYIKEHNLEPQPRVNKEEYLTLHFLRWPVFKKQYDARLRRYQIRKKVDAEVSTDMIIRLSGLQGKELGQFITDIGFKLFKERLVAKLVKLEKLD